MNGRLSIDDANDLLDAELPEGDWDTIGGLIFSMLGRDAGGGRRPSRSTGFRLRVERVQGRRIMRVRLTRVVPDAVDGDRTQEAA